MSDRDHKRLEDIRRREAAADAAHERKVLARRAQIDTRQRERAQRETEARDVPPGQTKGAQRVRDRRLNPRG